MKKIFVLIIILFSQCIAYSQNESDINNKVKIKIYLTAKDYMNKKFIEGEEFINKDSIIFCIKNIKDSTKIINFYFWGFSDSMNDFRVINKKLYKILDTNGIIIYENLFNNIFLFNSIMANSLISTGIAYSDWALYAVGIFYKNLPDKKYLDKENYFSLTLSSDLFEITKRNLIKVINNYDYKNEINNNFKWYKSKVILIKDENGKYLINNLYKNSKIK